MWKILLVSAVLVTVASSQHRSYSGSSSKGYSSSGRKSNDPYAPTFPFGPNGFGPNGFGQNGFIDPYEFHNSLTQQIQNQHQQQNSAVSMTFATPDANAFATASLFYPDNELFQEQFARQQAFFDALQKRTQYQAAAASSGAYAPNFASAHAGYGGGHFVQSASINPANPNIPNLSSRFGESSSGPGGFHGVSTSAFSESANVNGVNTNRRGASTTINDNGKVTTYNVHS